MARRKGRDVSGILLLDKPLGITSNAALQKVKWLYQANKAGHTGSLDPLASGMLPICLGEATKFSAHLLDADKHYRAICKLGVSTDTGDAEGQVVARHTVPDITPSMLTQMVARFSGAISQVPPMYSALKRDGVPLYELARKGVDVVREAREVFIHSLRVVRCAGDELEIEVHCSKGTYIRTLGEDIGAWLGCGAHLSYLRRTAVAGFPAERMVTLERLGELSETGLDALDALLLPVDQAIQAWPMLRLDERQVTALRYGQSVAYDGAECIGLYRLYSPNNCFIGVGELDVNGKLAPRRLVNQC